MKKNNNNLAQKDLLVEFFKKNPNRDIKHPEVFGWVVSTYKKRTDKVFRDPDRAIRQLPQNDSNVFDYYPYAMFLMFLLYHFPPYK